MLIFKNLHCAEILKYQHIWSTTPCRYMCIYPCVHHAILTLYNQPHPVGGGTSPTGSGTLVPCRVRWAGIIDVERGAALICLDAVVVVVDGDHAVVLLPTDHGDRDALAVRLQLHRLVFSHRRVLEALDEPRRTHRVATWTHMHHSFSLRTVCL